MAKGLKVLALFDVSESVERGHDFSEDFKTENWKAEGQVVRALKSLGHTVGTLGLHNDLHLLIDEIKEFQPDIVFNLMEEFDNDSSMVPNVVAVLELLKVPYTGASPLGLRLCKDKALTQTVLEKAGVPTPPSQVFEPDKAIRKIGALKYPLVVKPKVDDASYGIHQASVVYDDEALAERVRFIHEKTKEDALVEQYIKGRELYVSVLGTRRLRVFPMREVKFGKLAAGNEEPVASFKVKWDKEYRRKWNITYAYVKDMDEALVRRIEDMCKTAYRSLQLTGYARVDLRLTADNEPCILEVNPNPDIERYEDFSESAKKAGIPYEKLIQSILSDALSLPEEKENGKPS
jgi:D-alanine-D-alanine ligase